MNDVHFLRTIALDLESFTEMRRLRDSVCTDAMLLAPEQGEHMKPYYEVEKQGKVLLESTCSRASFEFVAPQQLTPA